MDSRFQTIFYDTNKFFQPGVDIIQISQLTAVDLQSGLHFGQVKFQNIFPKKIKGMVVSIRCFSQENFELEGIDPFEFMNLSVPPHASFGTNNTIIFPDQETVFYSIKILKVLFSDDTEFINNDPSDLMMIPKPEDISENKDYKKYKEVLNNYCTNSGIDSKLLKYKLQRSNDIWQCACGTINPSRDIKCFYCGVNLGDMLLLSNQEYWKQIEDKENKRIPQKRIIKKDASYDGIIEKIKNNQIYEDSKRNKKKSQIEVLKNKNTKKLGFATFIFIISIIFLIWIICF